MLTEQELIDMAGCRVTLEKIRIDNEASDFEIKDFVEAFYSSLNENQQLISKEVKSLVGNDKCEEERLRSIFIDLVETTISKYEKYQNKPSANLSTYYNNELKKACSQGITLREILLSQAIYYSGLCAGLFCDGKLKDAFKTLSLANQTIGEYRNYNEWCHHLNTLSSKKAKFKLDVLLKLIYGMAKNGYSCNYKNISSKSNLISTKLKRHSILIDDCDINKYLNEAFNAKEEWEESNHANSSDTLTKSGSSIMLKLIIGMAVDKYDYDPKATRRNNKNIPKNISEKLEAQCQVIVNHNTIRKYLNEAKELLV